MKKTETAAYRVGRGIAKAGRGIVRLRNVSGKVDWLAVLGMLLGILIGCFLAFGLSSHAQADGDALKVKYYKSVVVTGERGVDDLAAEYADPQYYSGREAYREEVAGINHLSLSCSEIHPGDRIVIPYYAASRKN